MHFPCRRSCWHLALLLVSFSTTAAPQELRAQEAAKERVFGGHLDAITMGVFAPDGTSIITASIDQTVRLWEIGSQTERRQYTQHTGPVFCLAVSGDGRTLASGAQDNTLRIWDLPLGKPLSQFRDHQTRVNAIAFSPSADRLLSVSADQTVRSRDLRQSEDPARIRSDHLDEVLSVAFRGDGAYFATGDKTGRILLWSPYLKEPQSELLAHQGAIRGLAFISNNQVLLTAGDDGVVRSWQAMPEAPTQTSLGDAEIIDWAIAPNQSRAISVARGGRVFVLNLPDGEVSAEHPEIAFSPTAIAPAPNSNWYGVADEAGNVHIRNFNDGSLIAVIAGHEGPVNDVAIRADSSGLATCGADGSIQIWNLPTENNQDHIPLQTFHHNSDSPVHATCVVFANDNRHVLGGAADGKIRQWRLDNGELLRTFDHGHDSSVEIRDLVISPNGQTLLSIAEDQTLRSWKWSDGTPLHSMQHPAPIRKLVVSPDSSRAAVACDDGAVRVWDLGSGQLLQSIIGQIGPIVSVAFLSDGQTVVSASLDRSLQVSKTAVIQAMPVHDRPIRSLSLYGGGSQFLTCDGETIVLSNTNGGTPVRQYRVLDDRQEEAEASSNEQEYRQMATTVVVARSDNQRVAAGTESGEVLVWNANNGETPVLTLQVDAPVTAIAYSPDNQKLAVATTLPEVRIYGPSIPGSLPQSELTLHQKFQTDANVSDLLFTSDNQSVFASLDNGEIQQWNYASIAQRSQLGHGGPVYGVAISRDGKIAVTCSGDQTVRVWDTTNGRQTAQMRGHNGAVHAIAISHDETFAVTSGADGTLRLWDIVGGRQLKQLTKFDATMYSVAIDPQGKLVAAAGADRKIHLLDMISGEERQVLEGHRDYIHCVAFNHSGDRLLSYGYAGQLKIWNASDGSLLSESQVGNVGSHAAFSPDDRQILLSGGDGTATLIAAP